MTDSGSLLKRALNRLGYSVAGRLGRYLILAVGRSMRLTGRGGKGLGFLARPGDQGIIVFWHNKLFYLSYCIAVHLVRKGGRVAVLISESRDGEYMARVASALGAEVIRGSSSRAGGSGFRRLCSLAGSGTSLCIAPDGPRGPRYEAKEGTIYLAQKTGLPILPVSYRPKGAVRFGSWDGFVLPLPFTSVEVRCGEPVRVPDKLSSKERKKLCLILQGRLMELE